MSDLAQNVRNVLEVSVQDHKHSFTCFKHLPKTLRSRAQLNKDCRFGIPYETTQSTCFDEDGHFLVASHSGTVNSHNPTIVSALGCNMDIKCIGSSTAAEAMCEYVTNYSAKSFLDSAVAVSALSAAMAKLNEEESENPDERTRSSFLVKACNQVDAKRELSGQQVAAYLMGHPNRYTTHGYANVYRTQLLKQAAPGIFASSFVYGEIEGHDEAQEDVSTSADAPAPEADIDLQDFNVILVRNSVENDGSGDWEYSELLDRFEVSLLHDLVFRPSALESSGLCSIISTLRPLYEAHSFSNGLTRREELGSYYSFAVFLEGWRDVQDAQAVPS